MMEKDRLGAFIDAVLAIIMTILVLELPRPETYGITGLWALRTNIHMRQSSLQMLSLIKQCRDCMA